MSNASKASDEGEPLLTKLRLALAGIALTFVGAMVSTWFSDRSTTWLAYVAKIDKDNIAILNAYKDAADLINERWYALLQMAAAIEHSTGPDELAAVRKGYAEVDKKWALKFTTIESDIRFNVDETFPTGENAAQEDDDLKLISSMPCTRSAGSENWQAIQKTRSARVIMALVNRCLGEAKRELDEALIVATGDPVKPDAARLANLLKQPYVALDLAYWTHSALRCVVLERELALRPIALKESYWHKFFGTLPARYDPPVDSKNCQAHWVAHSKDSNVAASSADLVN
jgi:hypothetical protein